VLKLSTGALIDLPLKATCKKIADEMSGVALQTNTIHFYQSGRTNNTNIPFDALRLMRLVDYVDITRWRMFFLCVRECRSDAIVKQVQQEYPDHHFIAAYKLGLDEYFHLHGLSKFQDWYCISDKHSIYSKRALQRCLDLASTHPQFEELIAAACSDHMPPNDFFYVVTFRPGTHMEILHWGVEPWSIPSTADLDHMESLLVHSDKHDFARLTRPKWVKWKFSACAVAIDALGRLPTRSLENVSSVVLHEDSIAVYGPECHSQGFVSLVAQNPRLRIKGRVKGI
jgi:hypothetical protein